MPTLQPQDRYSEVTQSADDGERLTAAVESIASTLSSIEQHLSVLANRERLAILTSMSDAAKYADVTDQLRAEVWALRTKILQGSTALQAVISWSDQANKEREEREAEFEAERKRLAQYGVTIGSAP